MHKDNSYEEVIKRNSDMVYRLAYSLVKTRADADDIYQEVFMRYLRKDPVFESGEHEKAWFARVTVNCCKNYWKSPWIRRRAVLQEADGVHGGKRTREGAAAGEADPCFGAAQAGPDSEGQLLIETVKQLPEKYRTVIHLFYYEDMSIEEIGKITGMKASTVRTRLTRARKRLREKLGGF